MSVNIGRIKIRPVVIIIALGLVLALNVVAAGLMIILTTQGENLDIALIAAIIAFGGNIITATGVVASKLIESEEKGQ